MSIDRAEDPRGRARPTIPARHNNGRVTSSPGCHKPVPGGTGPHVHPGAPTGPVTELVLREPEQILEDRERLAADLHDHVIQRLFAVVMNVERVAGTLGRGPLAARLEAAVDDLDDIITQLRHAIRRLQQMPPVADDNGVALAGRLLDVITAVTPALGFTPFLRFTGLDVPLPQGVDEDLLAVLREALTNVARHAQAGSTEVEVSATPDRLTVKVTDDGTGIGTDPARRSGLGNMYRRARDHHGAFSVEPLHESGTRLTWSVPLR
jgi:signal transduction histidine kinase